jgi:hypothetical protein
MLAALGTGLWLGASAEQPVIYCTDLFHPHEDPDDHFDLATLYALPGIKIEAIVLDQGLRQAGNPGRIPVSQLNRLCGRQVPAATGLATPLKHPGDTGVDQAPEHQGGVRLILDTLRRSREPMAMAAVGSVRDVVAAFNREPDLFRDRVSRLLCFIGEASRTNFTEYNVNLDLQAFVGLMRSGLPVFWVPCFDGGLWRNEGHASFWQARQGDLLGRAPAGLVQYFLYALNKETADPLPWLDHPVDPKRRDQLFDGIRNLWCTAVFAALRGECVVAGADGRMRFEPDGVDRQTPPVGALFTFEPVEVTVAGTGIVRYGPGPESRRLWRYKVLDPARYAAGMTAATADRLAAFPLQRR